MPDPVRRTTRAAILALILLTMFGPAVPAFAAPGEAGSASRASIDGDPLTPGTTAIVRSDGDLLNLRDAPGLGSVIIDKIPDGATVQVLPGVVEADEYRWQLVLYGQQPGWAADAFLRPYDAPPAAGGGCTASVQPGLTGGLAASGGVALGVWGGGTLGGMETLARSQDCRLASVWASRPGGGLVGFRFGAPDFVNREWLVQFGGTYVAAGLPLLTICQQRSGEETISVTSIAPVPAPIAPAPAANGIPAPAVSALAAIVVDEASGAVLYDKQAFEPLPPASLTKIVTAILALEGADLDQWVSVTDVDYRQMPGSSVMGIVPGDCFLLRDLLYGLMLPSGNDAALAIGRYQAGSDQAFLDLMHSLVARLGLSTSTFTDPHGLGGPGHRMSAYDIAMLSRYAMTMLPSFREIVTAPAWTANGQREVWVRNVNSFVSSYNGADGVKTGFTSQAGRTLAASATRDGRRLYVVVLNAPDRFGDAEALLDWAFANHAWQ